MASTLIIGIGTTGLRILEQAEQFHYELTGLNKPGRNVEYLYLETDINAKPRINASGKTEIEHLLLNLGSHAKDLNQLRNNNKVDSSWLPTANQALSNADGAGGMPSFGRLAIWGDDNY